MPRYDLHPWIGDGDQILVTRIEEEIINKISQQHFDFDLFQKISFTIVIIGFLVDGSISFDSFRNSQTISGSFREPCHFRMIFQLTSWKLRWTPPTDKFQQGVIQKPRSHKRGRGVPQKTITLHNSSFVEVAMLGGRGQILKKMATWFVYGPQYELISR